MAHYFTDNTDLKSESFDYKTTILGREFSFTSDNGVFSKEHLDFGSRLLIESFKNPTTEGVLLDLGCGIGVIGITLAKEYNRSCFFADVNPRAIDLTIKNATKNGIKFEAKCMNCLDEVNGLFAVMVTNPPIRAGKKVIYNFFTEGYDHLLNNGELWAVMRRNQGAESAVKKLTEIFGNCEVVERKNGFWILKSTKCV